jgi:hypothetical protein
MPKSKGQSALEDKPKREIPDAIIPESEPCLTIAQVEFRDESIAIIALLSKADRTVIQSVVSGYKELKPDAVKKLGMKSIPIWEYGKSTAEKLKTCELLSLDDIKNSKISNTREEKRDVEDDS